MIRIDGYFDYLRMGWLNKTRQLSEIEKMIAIQRKGTSCVKSVVFTLSRCCRTQTKLKAVNEDLIFWNGQLARIKKNQAYCQNYESGGVKIPDVNLT